MAWGIESRVPLLDYRIVELLSRMPPIMKFKGGQSKVIIKEISANWLPKSIINRKDKMGFPVPLGDWMQSGVIKEFVHDILLSSESPTDSSITLDWAPGASGDSVPMFSPESSRFSSIITTFLFLSFLTTMQYIKLKTKKTTTEPIIIDLVLFSSSKAYSVIS